MSSLPEGTPELIAAALEEDLGSGDVTAMATVPADVMATARIIRKQPGVVYGFDVVEEVFRQVGVEKIDRLIPEGEWHDRDREDVLHLEGTARDLLACERVALNFLGHLSGIATLTARYVDAITGTAARMLDTRKTTPGLRALEKAAVKAGGGVNHRFGLWDAVLIKENHVAMAGGVGAAIRACRELDPNLPVEIEVENLNELEEALAAGPDRVMLDNFDPATTVRAVAIRNETAPGVELEASGNVSLETVAGIAATGVDFISAGALTHSAPQLDLSMLLDPRT